jgi:hypothetical protein
MPRKRVPLKSAVPAGLDAAIPSPPPPAEQVWARISDIVARFHISENTLRRRMKDGLVRSSKVHGIRAIDVRSVEAMFEAGTHK